MFEIFSEPSLNHYIQLFGYLGIFIFFTTIDQVTFVPEEVTLISIGYLGAGEVFNPLIAGVVAFIAFVAVDCAYYFLAGSGLKLFQKLKNKMNEGRISEWKEKLREHFPKTLFVLCFIPRMRMWAPVFSGIMKISFKRFISYDSMALSVFTAFYISIGYFFHRSLHSWMAELKILRHSLFSALMLILAVFILIAVKRFDQQKNTIP